ncbi:MAG: LptA/OstA family protein [bacterium]|nr:hypothetical protein [Candidatus Margulisiibacteriota bacterium]
MANAQDIPVDLKADTLTYLQGTRFIRATGSVEVEINNVKIFADTLLMDPETNIATAEGNVRMETKSYQAFSERIVYDANQDLSTFKGFSSRVTPQEKVQGDLYLSAGEIKDLKNKMLGSKGRLTTCDYREDEHFDLVADKVEFYPGDKIIGYNVTLFIASFPALWMPIMYYDLHEQQRRNWQFGHNEVEGDYIKSSWGYPYGVLYLDLMEKKGFGLGTKTPYKLLTLGSGLLYLYHIKENDTGITDWVSRINHTKQINSATTLKLDHSYTTTYLIPSGRKDLTTLGFDLGYNDQGRWNLKFDVADDRIGSVERYNVKLNKAFEKTSTNISYDYSFLENDPKWIRSSANLSHSQPVWADNIMLSTRINYRSNLAQAGQSADELLEPMVDLTGREKTFSWRVTANKYIDLDRNTYVADNNHQYFEKLPEIEISPNSLNLSGFNLTSKFGYGKYHEVRYVSALGSNRNYTSERLSSSLDLGRSVPLGLGTVAVLGAGVDQYLYAPGDQLYSYREKMSLNTNLGGFFRNNINYTKGNTDGNSPFLFDKLGTHYHNVRQNLTLYYKSNVNFNLTGGHNWQTHKWFDVLGSLLVRPSSFMNWNLNSGWDIENRRYKDLVNSLTLIPVSFYTTSFSTISDLNTGQLKSGTLVHDLFFLQGQINQWHLRLGQVFEAASQEFKLRDIMIVKDLHCWEMKYTYSDYRREFSFTFSMKAMPDDPIGMSSGRGFYIESFDKLEKEVTGIKQEGAIERY